MAYKSLYRKYRPESFDDMVGQKHIVQTLKNAILSNKVAHAYIFSGPRGTGKTSLAKILAKAVNCLGDNKPCNNCENCNSINNNSFSDIIEIDAASNNGVEEIRDLIDKVKYAPIAGKYKVYIIDEVHMLTSGAFNALLKTLEEPPEHVIFILATTDVHKVIPTILSRCQRFDFSKISLDDIKNRISYILNKEHISYEEKVPELVAELADGGLRDALSILDQIISYANDNIQLKHIYEIYGMMSSFDMVRYLNLLAKKDAKQTIETIESFINKGIDVKRLTYDLLVCLKDAIVYSYSKDESILERLNKELANSLLSNYSIEQAMKVSEVLNEARSNYKLSTNYRLYFELASLKIIDCFENKVLTNNVSNEYESKQINEDKVIETISPTIQENIEPIVESETTKEEVSIEKEPIIESSVAETLPIQDNPKTVEPKTDDEEIIDYPFDEYINILNNGDKKTKEDLNEKWEEIANYLNNDKTKYAAQLLIDSKVGAANKNFVLLVYELKFIANKVKQKNNLFIIKKFLKENLQIDVEVFVVDKNMFLELTTKFYKLWQAAKLPIKHQIPITTFEQKEVIVSDESEDLDQTTMLGKELFGDDLKVN